MNTRLASVFTALVLSLGVPATSAFAQNYMPTGIERQVRAYDAFITDPIRDAWSVS